MAADGFFAKRNSSVNEVKFRLMNKESELWDFALSKLRRGEPVMLLVVAESAGSSPGRQGFKMFVARDDLAGSIGGGVMEIALAERAKFKIQNSKFKVESEIVEQIHRMICSGKQTVVFYRLSKNDLPTVEAIVRALVGDDRESYIRLTNNELAVIARKIPPFDFSFTRSDENEFVYEEKLGSKNRLFIVGGGHCALALSEIVSKMDFRIALFDDRADLNTLAKNEFAHEKRIIESYERIGEFIAAGANHYVVVMTLGYKYDEIVIRKLFDKDFKYFGVLGSRAKMKTLLKTLEKEGFDRERLKKIRTPVGIKINSRTPEEIAVSIAAEIIAVKNA
jgi:xanthine dehydrogenase accessory factor